jgi:hypothetical protein
MEAAILSIISGDWGREDWMVLPSMRIPPALSSSAMTVEKTWPLSTGDTSPRAFSTALRISSTDDIELLWVYFICIQIL